MKKVVPEALPDIRRMFVEDFFDLERLNHFVVTCADATSCRVLAEIMNQTIEEYWHQGRCMFKIKERITSLDVDSESMERIIYEGMPTIIYRGNFDQPLFDGVVRLRLMFRLGWKEDLLFHQHQGGRMVNIHRGVGKFVAYNDHGHLIETLMEPHDLICMPPYTAHNFRALTDTEAILYVAEKLRARGTGEVCVLESCILMSSLLRKVAWNKDWQGQSEAELRRMISQNTMQVLEAFDHSGVIQKMLLIDVDTVTFLRSLLTDLLTLELDSLHVRYVDVGDKNNAHKALFHEKYEDGKKNPFWRDVDISRTEHHERVKRI